jgi:hypothetical protein
VSTLADLSRPVRVADSLEIKSTYKSFTITANVLLGISENPDLYVYIVHALPFTIFQDCAVVGGESECAWTPAYGAVTEDIEPPELGEALPGFEQALAWVGHCVEEHLRNQGTHLTYGESGVGEAEGGTYVTLDSNDKDLPCFFRFYFHQIPPSGWRVGFNVYAILDSKVNLECEKFKTFSSL